LAGAVDGRDMTFSFLKIVYLYSFERAFCLAVLREFFPDFHHCKSVQIAIKEELPTDFHYL
jgi:hypothetical protein